MGDPSGLVEELARLLPEGRVVAVEAIGPAAMLPWELARPLVWRRSSRVPALAYPSDDAQRPGAVLLMAPGETRDEESEVGYAATSGVRLASFYESHSVAVEYTYGTESEGLHDELRGISPPTLIHIVASMRESRSGAYLDFEGAVRRARLLKGIDGEPDTQLNPFGLDRALAILPQPPFVLLDIARPRNLTEAVRMLLLRNLFATHLFELRHVRGILGCGLGEPEDRGRLLDAIVRSLLSDTVSAPLQRSRTGLPDPLEYLLPWRGMALWTNDPDDRLFESSASLANATPRSRPSCAASTPSSTIGRTSPRIPSSGCAAIIRRYAGSRRTSRECSKTSGLSSSPTGPLRRTAAPYRQGRELGKPDPRGALDLGDLPFQARDSRGRLLP